MRSRANSLHAMHSHLRIHRALLRDASKQHATWMLGLALGLMIAPWFYTTAARALSMRTYVSGRGNDSNACTNAAPCLTLQGALAKTLAGGEIDALNSGNYGYVTINQAITIVGGSNVAGVLAPSSVTGITINAGSNDIINLHGLDIDGAGSGTNGIQFTSGAALNIQDSMIRGFANGIKFQPSGSSALSVGSTLVSNNITGIMFQSASASMGVLNDVQLVNNPTGLSVLGTGSTPVNVTVQNSLVTTSSTVGILSGGSSTVQVVNSTITNNSTGVQAQRASGVLNLTGSTVTGNATGWLAQNGGQVLNSTTNSISGNTTGDTAPPTSSAPAPTTIAKNIVTDFGATCNGVADDTPKFMSFNSWAKVQSLPITLTIPSGSVCNFASTPATFALGVKNLVVSGYGANFTTTLGSFYLGGYSIVQNNTTSALVATVAAGANSVTLLTPSQSSRFAVGQYVLLTGGDTQGYGFPPNPWVFEYVRVTGINAGTGVISLGAPLQYSYKSTWPSYYAGSGSANSDGGPATLYALDPSWDTVLEYRGMTFNTGGGIYAPGRSIKFTDVTFSGCGSGGGLAPTQSLNITLANVTMLCQIEIDKVLSSLDIEGGNFSQLLFQSSSGATLFTMNNATVTLLNGAPQKSVIGKSTIGTFIPGTLHFGRTTEISCTSCSIGAFKILGGGSIDSHVETNYAMSGGVITVPNSHGPVAWAVPSANAMFAVYNGYVSTEGVPFTVTDITQDTSNTYIHTSLTGGFPLLPTDSNTGLSIYGHPAPKFTCTDCTGGSDAVDLSQAPAGAPIWSYTNRTYTGNNLPLWAGQQLTYAGIFGSVVSVKINVTKPYTGTQSTLTLNALGPYGISSIAPDGSQISYNPTIDLRTAGERDIFPSSVTGAQSGDNISVPGAIWFSYGYSPTISADISGESSSVWPTVTIEITTQQGLINQ